MGRIRRAPEYDRGDQNDYNEIGVMKSDKVQRWQEVTQLTENLGGPGVLDCDVRPPTWAPASGACHGAPLQPEGSRRRRRRRTTTTTTSKGREASGPAYGTG